LSFRFNELNLVPTSIKGVIQNLDDNVNQLKFSDDFLPSCYSFKLFVLVFLAVVRKHLAALLP